MSARTLRPAISVSLAAIILTNLLIVCFSLSSNITAETCRRLGIPILFIETEYRKSILSKEKYLDATYTLNENHGTCKIKGRGNTTWTFRKKPYLLKLDIATELLSLPAAQKWVLLSNMCDKTSLRNVYANHLAKTVFNRYSWTPSSEFITLFINGRYEGLYSLSEKVERGENRLSLPDEPEKSMLFVANSRLSEEFNFRTKHDVPVSFEDENLTEKDFLRGKEIIQNFEDSLFTADFPDDSSWKSYIDEDSFIDWYLINEFAKNRDARLQASCFFYYDAGKNRIFMGPAWDFDIGFGGSHMDKNYEYTDWWVRTSPWYTQMLKDKTFAHNLKIRWNEKYGTLTDSFEWLAENGRNLEEAANLNDLVWKTFGRKQWPHTPGYKDRKTYDAEVAYLLDWVRRRAAWMNQEINK